MKEKELIGSLEAEVKHLTSRINLALTEINGKKHLPLWLEDMVNGPISSISADTLQGIKIGVKVFLRRSKEIIREETK